MKFSVFVVEGRGEIAGDWCRVSGLIVSKESWHTVWQSSLRRRRADHVGRLSRPTAARPLGGTVLHRWSRLCRRHSSRARHWLLVATQHTHTHSDYFQLVLITLIVHRLCRWLGKTIAVVICIHSVDWNSYTRPFMFPIQQHQTIEVTRSIWKMLGPFATASCFTHSPGVATRRLCIDVYNNDDNDYAWQRGPLWPHGMGPMKWNAWYLAQN